MMKPSDNKNQDTRDGNAPLVAACEMEISTRHDDKKEDT
jgi:hypothetical protein